MSDENSPDEFSGGSVSYYKVQVEHPTTDGSERYTAECNDIIEALDMSFAEANVFKAVWRSAAARKGKRKAGYDHGKYDAEKVVFYGRRMLARAERVRPGEATEVYPTVSDCDCPVCTYRRTYTSATQVRT